MKQSKLRFEAKKAEKTENAKKGVCRGCGKQTTSTFRFSKLSPIYYCNDCIDNKLFALEEKGY